ncbi:membrane dipeptidase [Colidextribacter sp. OB.20]|uniref:dipeptidase n=1 Tax=Colidextribacter sp. OB.20 TaxID=2304568 RepID=UPI00136D0446|nr:membrane dipeptidase [Colidextribacter sp. OB.20]
MLPYALIDLHCDTLTALRPEDAPLLAALRDPARRRETASALADRVRETNTLDLPGRHFSLSAIPEGVHWCQCCAIFIPDGLIQEEAVSCYDLHRRSFSRQMEALSDKVLPCHTADSIESAWAQGKAAAVLTVENGSALAGQLDRVETLARDGVRMVTLTWNGENEIGSGSGTDHGLSSFGREAVRALEEHSILVDVSHLNDRGFNDLLKTASRPFVASHSNARAVCGHRRNLADEQIREMVRRGCLIGLNYCVDFLHTGDRPAGLDDLWRHVEHLLELGAERCLALGSDADGADFPPGLDSPERFAGLYPYLLDRGLSTELAEGILWKNALGFFRKIW